MMPVCTILSFSLPPSVALILSLLFLHSPSFFLLTLAFLVQRDTCNLGALLARADFAHVVRYMSSMSLHGMDELEPLQHHAYVFI